MLFRINLNKKICYILLLALSACSKNDEPAPSLEDGKSTVIYNLAGDTKASMMEGIDGKQKRDFYTFLFHLDGKRQIWLRPGADSSAMKSNTWDLAFSGPYNSLVSINNATQKDNPGYEGPVTKTAIMMLNMAYEALTTAPDDATFNDNKLTTIGEASSQHAHGWYTYDAKSHIMKPYKNRTYALRLANGKYAKLQLLSVYKNNPPVVTDLFWPAPYLTFRYFVQQDGSRNLRTN